MADTTSDLLRQILRDLETTNQALSSIRTDYANLAMIDKANAEAVTELAPAFAQLQIEIDQISDQIRTIIGRP